MKLDDFAFKRGNEFFKILKNEIILDETENFFYEFIYYNRLYNDIWKNNFEKGFFHSIKAKNIDFFKEFYNHFFKEQYNISHNDIENIKYILKNKNFFHFKEKNKEDFENIYDFLFYKRTLFFKKNLYNLSYFFSQIEKFNKKENLFLFFNEINKVSLTQKIFKNKDNSYTFEIPKNKGPFFSFWINNKVINIDSSMTDNINKKIQINSLIFSLLSSDKSPKDTQQNIIKINKEYPEIILNKIKNIYDQNIFNINENFLYFSFDDLKPLTGFLNPKDELILNQISNENNFIFSEYIPETLYQILTKNRKNLNHIFDNNIQMLEKRREWINSFFVSIFSKEKLDQLQLDLHQINPAFFHNIYSNTINKIKHINNIPEHHIKEALFNEFCFDSSNDFQSFLIEIEENYQNNKDIMDHINSKEDQLALITLLKALLNTR